MFVEVNGKMMAWDLVCMSIYHYITENGNRFTKNFACLIRICCLRHHIFGNLWSYIIFGVGLTIKLFFVHMYD